jgi:pimeloyl-ACP methyl ester carboxylesterase
MNKLFRPLGARKKSLKQRQEALIQTPTQHGYFKSFDGTKLFYSIEGEGKPLIFCYGLVCSSLHWTYQIEHFKKNYKTIWMDYRGHQNSEVPTDFSTLTLESLARDLDVMMTELKIESAVLLGHSMGVNVVLEFCRLFPHRVAGMILANGTPSRPLETLLHTNGLEPAFQFMEFISKNAPKLLNFFWKTQKANPLVHKAVGVLGFNPHLTAAEDIQLYVDQIADLDPRVFLHLIRNYDHFDGSSWLHNIQAPTLVIAGENDLIVPFKQQELLHQLIPNSEWEPIRHGSHCVQMDLPDLVSQKIEDFLKKTHY